MPEEILTLREVAGYLKLAEKMAYKLAAEWKLPALRSVEAGGLRKKILNNGSKRTRNATNRLEEHRDSSSW